jgi:hypothetical protein
MLDFGRKTPDSWHPCSSEVKGDIYPPNNVIIYHNFCVNCRLIVARCHLVLHTVTLLPPTAAPYRHLPPLLPPPVLPLLRPFAAAAPSATLCHHKSRPWEGREAAQAYLKTIDWTGEVTGREIGEGRTTVVNKWRSLMCVGSAVTGWLSRHSHYWPFWVTWMSNERRVFILFCIIQITGVSEILYKHSCICKQYFRLLILWVKAHKSR